MSLSRRVATSPWTPSATIAATGVDAVAVGALTHSVRTLDIGLDWEAA